MKWRKRSFRISKKGTGKKVRELDLTVSTTETDKSLRSLIRARKQNMKDKEKIETKTRISDPAKSKKEKAVDD